MCRIIKGCAWKRGHCLIMLEMHHKPFIFLLLAIDAQEIGENSASYYPLV